MLLSIPFTYILLFNPLCSILYLWRNTGYVGVTIIKPSTYVNKYIQYLIFSIIFHQSKLINLIMFTYYIAGVPKCPDFGHAKFVAEKLRRSLPYFSYEVIVKTEKEYQVIVVLKIISLEFELPIRYITLFIHN